MYCQSCGAEQTQGLIYCNRCGANLNSTTIATIASLPVAPVVSLTKPIVIISIFMLVVSLGGFLIVMEAARDLASTPNFDVHLLSLMVIAAMAIIMIVDVTLAVLLMRLVNAALRGTYVSPVKEIAAPKQKTRQLDAPRDYIGSVTEQTTRTLEPVYKEPRA